MLPVLLFLIFISAFYFTIHPLFSQRSIKIDSDINQTELTKKRRLINLFKQIRETEFEHEMGITAEEDFNRTRDELKSEAAILLENVKQSKHLDIINCKSCNCKNEISNKFCLNCGTNLKKLECPKCQAELKKSDKFCSQCGTNI